MPARLSEVQLNACVFETFVVRLKNSPNVDSSVRPRLKAIDGDIIFGKFLATLEVLLW